MKKRNLYIVYVLIALVFGLSIFLYELHLNNQPLLYVAPQTPVVPATTTQEIASTSPAQPLSLIVVSTVADQQHGLGDRASLPADQGMLFVFPTASNYGIWMKDMQFSIDIISLDANFAVVHVESNVSPATYPSVFYSPSTTKYIIETNAGYAIKNNLQVGEVLDFAQKAVNK